MKFDDAKSVYDHCFEVSQDLAEEMYYKSGEYAKGQTVSDAINSCRRHITFVLNELMSKDYAGVNSDASALYIKAGKITRDLVETMEVNSVNTKESVLLARSNIIGMLRSAIDQMGEDK